jgi:eukaryotic-like serine/threonine-protein kinase
MTPERWRQIDLLYHDALERDAGRRAAFLDRACAGDAELRRDVESLLASHERAGGFIAEPALKVAARVLASERAESLVGRVLAHYRIVSLLGAGGMGEVYLAEDTRLGRRVALKLLPAHFTRDGERLGRFEREARAASSLNHPNVCVIHEVGEAEGGRRYIVMEYVEGVTLRERMAGARMKLGEVLDVAAQIASALAAAHASGIVHRDIKPENVMLREDGYLKVLDFGLAKLTERRRVGDSEGATRRLVETETGMVMGTATYMSPEQARGLTVDERTDIWSLGVVLYEMVTGRVPFEGATTSDVIASILERESPPLTRYLPEVPAELQRIITKALRKDREERYQTVKDMLPDLKSLRGELELAAKSERSMHPASSGGVAGQGSRSQGKVAVAGRSARVAVAQTANPTAEAESLSGKIRRHKAAAALTLAALVAAVAGAAYVSYLMYQRGGANPQSPQRSLSRLTFDAGLQREPTWSPDGRFIAYSSDRSGNFDIWVQPVGGGDAVQVTKSPAHDWQPDWSPDGSQIVFRSEREGGGLFAVPALGGRERKISSFGYFPRWSPDGSRILFSDQMYNTAFIPNFPKLYVVTPDGNPPREVLSELLADFVELRSAIWHPDGRRVSLFGMRKNLGWGLWTVPLAGGTAVKSELGAEVEKQFNKEADFWWTLSNLRWSPSGRAIYFDVVRRGVRNLWRVNIDPQTLRWVSGPERLTTGFNDTDTTLSPDGRRLAFTVRAESTRAWSLPFDARAGELRGKGQPVTAAGMYPEGLDLSPDSRRLLYVAYVPGKLRRELWEKSLEGGGETLLAVSDKMWFPCWSRDGTRIAYHGWNTADSSATSTTGREGIKLFVHSGGGGDEQVIASGANDIVWDWSADGQWLLASTDRQSLERWGVIGLFPLSGAPHAEAGVRVVTSHPEYNLFQARFSPDDRWVCFEAVKSGDVSTIYVVPAGGGEWIRITEDSGRSGQPHWSPDGRTIYFVSNRGTGFDNVWGIHFDPEQGKPVGEPFRVTSFDSPGRIIKGGIALSGDRLAVPIEEATGSIWVLDDVDR